ncbi:MAG TPA: SusC/RagA family TonB-linked outer membrane protein, partial [Cyclobacteriaceae bacterium]|nr:SusC/RagA family TonB-linked outer membrane protein [Cyclobacteriaceae bacterium]
MNKPNPVQRGLLFLMKVTLIHIFFSSISLVMAHPLTSLSQGILDKKVSINIENTKVQAALSLLSEEADVKFTYSPSLFSTSQAITLHMTDVKLATVLEALLNPGISYKVIGNQIALNPGDLAPNPPRTITGKIVDEKGEDLPGASIVVKGTTNGTISDAKGTFTLNNVEDDAVLQISSIGYKTQEVNAGQQTVINAKMEPDITELSEVVVIGYGEVKKSDITGSVGSVSAQELTAYPVPNIAMGLQGKTAGVVVQQNSGAPGSGISVRIRGGNSLQGSSEPLYVVDGFALNGDPSAINPADIESMEVLKDASSTAIYGSRGANGVVLITTKKGKAGAPSITLDSYFAMQKVGKLLDLMNASEFAQLANERLTNDGFAPQFTTDQVAQFGEGTNWQNEIYRSAPMQSHTVTVSGGSNKSQYSVSGSLLDQNGIVIGSNQQRQSLRASMNQSLGNNDKVKLGVNIVLTNTSVGQLNADNGQKGSTVTSAAVGAPPTVDVYNPDGTYTNVQAYPWSPNSLVHPVAFAIERTQQSNTKYILANTALSYEPIKGLILKTTAGVETSIAKTKTYSPTIIFNTPTGQASIAYAEGLNFLNENTVAYSKKFGGIHELSGLGGFTFQRNVGENTNTGNVSGFTTDALGANNLQSGSVSTIPSSGYSKWILLSYLGRVNYSLNGKYLFTASIRADGSSRFGNGNKWGTFPSGAVAWRIIEENFMKRFNFLSDMKVRASYGVTGSTALNPYQTLSSLTPLTTVFNDSQFTGYGPSLTALSNPDLKWETTAQSDVGLDIGLLSNRVSITTDYYVKNTSDLLQSVSIPTSSGFSSTIRNIGKVRNSGVEFALSVIA